MHVPVLSETELYVESVLLYKPTQILSLRGRSEVERSFGDCQFPSQPVELSHRNMGRIWTLRWDPRVSSKLLLLVVPPETYTPNQLPLEEREPFSFSSPLSC